MVAVSSANAPLIAIVGATGNQGGSVLRHIIASKKGYRVRAITRDPSKASSKVLADQGAEVVKGDLGDPSSIQEAFKGADYVFGVTDFWSTMDAAKEIADGKVLVDSAKAAGVKLFIWSGLESVTKVSGGKFTKVYHFDSKAVVTDYAKASALPVAVVQAGFYCSNFVAMMPPRKQEDGSFALALPVSSKTLLPLLDADKDYGAYVVEALESPFGAGSEVLAAAEYISIAQIVKIWSDVSGRKIKHKEVSEAAFVEMIPHGGEELAEMFGYFQEFGYFGGKDIGPSQAGLKAPTSTFEDYAKGVKWDKVLI